MMEGLYGLQYSLYDDPPTPPSTGVGVGLGVGAATNYYYDNAVNLMPPPPPPEVAAMAFDMPPYMYAANSSALSDSASSMAVVPVEEDASAAQIRAQIVSHPSYPKLLQAYIDCQKVGAPAEVACVLDEIRRETDVRKITGSTCFGADPELDEFMETYCDILQKYKSDLSRPFEEATSFLKNIENQLNNLCRGSSRNYIPDECGGNSSEDDASGGETEIEMADYCHGSNEDRELMDKLMRKYSGYISALKHEFSRKKKRGKLPKEARDILLGWWNLHYKWPYPTEVDKVALSELTGLDQKQINNWFINQRKRHWKPSENMQFSVMETLYGPFFHD